MKNVRYIWILWPSFLAAAAGNAVFFTVFDPSELVVFGEPVQASRIGLFHRFFQPVGDHDTEQPVDAFSAEVGTRHQPFPLRLRAAAGGRFER